VVKDSSNRVLSDQEVAFYRRFRFLVCGQAGSRMTRVRRRRHSERAAIRPTGPSIWPRKPAACAPQCRFSRWNAIGISGLNSLSLGDSTDLTISLSNSGNGNCRQDRDVTRRRQYLTLPAPPSTSSNGQITAHVAATATAMIHYGHCPRRTNTFALNVNPSVLTMTAPLSAAEAAIGTSLPVSVTLTNDGSPVAGAIINFMTTREP